MDDIEFSEIMLILSTAYSGYAFKDNTVKVYKMLLNDIPVESLRMGALKHVSENKWFPSVAELREAAFSVMLNKPSIPSSFEAWQEAIEHCRLGDYTNYSHPLIEKAVQVIGIDYWRSMLTEQEMATRAQFIKIYESLFNRAEDDVKRLPTVTAAMNKNMIAIESGLHELTKKLSV